MAMKYEGSFNKLIYAVIYDVMVDLKKAGMWVAFIKTVMANLNVFLY